MMLIAQFDYPPFHEIRGTLNFTAHILGVSPFSITDIDEDEPEQEPKYIVKATEEKAKLIEHHYADSYIESITEAGVVRIVLTEAVVTRSINVTED